MPDSPLALLIIGICIAGFVLTVLDDLWLPRREGRGFDVVTKEKE